VPWRAGLFTYSGRNDARSDDVTDARDRLVALAERYRRELERLGARASDLEEDVLVVPGVSQDVLRDHLAWRCEEVKTLATSVHDVGAARRWIGFIQGALWAMGHFSIEDMRGHEADAARDPVRPRPPPIRRGCGIATHAGGPGGATIPPQHRREEDPP
jgi:hypothetical protein